MITIKVSENESGVITKIVASGHAGYDVFGKDIVCAAVSTAIQLTSLVLKRVLGDDVKIYEYESGISIDVGSHGHDREVMCLMYSLYEFVVALSREYTENVEVVVDKP